MFRFLFVMLIRKTKYFSQLMRNICQELIMINDSYRMHVRKIKIINKINKNVYELFEMVYSNFNILRIIQN